MKPIKYPHYLAIEILDITTHNDFYHEIFEENRTEQFRISLIESLPDLNDRPVK